MSSVMNRVLLSDKGYLNGEREREGRRGYFIINIYNDKIMNI